MTTDSAQARQAEPSPLPMQYSEDSEFAILTRAMAQSLQDGHLDESEAMYARLCTMDARAESVLIFPVMFAIQRGKALQALQLINELPADRCPELRVLCLNVLGDPSWHGEATALLDSPNPTVRKAMRELLCKPLDS
ncbi:MAG: hypothetical protein EOO28_24455 [Comamonadaceae bacterium]|nr:MAG: hypothetical protein EOO28_24455 [Comamonadaceae bacterium]